MKKQKKQMIFMLLVVAILFASYMVLQRQNSAGEEATSEDTTEKLFDQFGSETDSSQVTELSYYVGEELCSFVKEEDVWKAKEDKELTLRQSSINTMVSCVVATSIVSRLEDVADLSQYGLQEPANTITLKVAGTEHVIKVGDSNDLTSYLYLQMDDSDTVYVVSSGISNSFNQSLDDLVEVEESEVVEETEAVEETEVVEDAEVEETEATEDAEVTEETEVIETTEE